MPVGRLGLGCGGCEANFSFFSLLLFFAVANESGVLVSWTVRSTQYSSRLARFGH